MELYEEEKLLLMDFVEENKVKRNIAWFMDSECSNRMCGNRGMFFDILDKHKHCVKSGNNSRVSIVEKGNVRLMINDTTFLIQDVY